MAPVDDDVAGQMATTQADVRFEIVSLVVTALVEEGLRRSSWRWWWIR
jgi:hypothetical protein